MKDPKRTTVAIIGTGRMAADAISRLAGAGPARRTDKLDAVTKPPTSEGSHGRAWVLDHERLNREAGLTPDQDATVRLFIVEADWAHPLWHSYAIFLVHLRPMPDARPTAIYLEGATHELWLFALDPEIPRQRMIEKGFAGALLQPINFAAQIIAESDQAAAALVEKAVAEICDGVLSPDTDARQMWIERFGGNMIRT